MISVDEASERILQHCHPTAVTSCPLKEAGGRVAASALVSPIHFPSFRQSAMDGYALRYSDFSLTDTFLLTGEIPAGCPPPDVPLSRGSTRRIFTGAAVPDDADTIIRQEDVVRSGDQIHVLPHARIQGTHIRDIASQTQAGSCVCQKGQYLSAGTIGLLAGLGITTLPVFEKPRCRILLTGKELVYPPQSLLPGQIYESNGMTLTAALNSMQLQPSSIRQVDDEQPLLRETIATMLQQTDVLLITGGVSVGEYDFVAQSLQELGVITIFHGVRQKPGKPFYFGVMNKQLIFGLPGNPGSVLTCFYQYVVPALYALSGQPGQGLRKLSLPLQQSFTKKAGLTHFLKGRLDGNSVRISEQQESYKMNAFAEADLLVRIDEQTTFLHQGDLVDVFLLPV